MPLVYDNLIYISLKELKRFGFFSLKYKAAEISIREKSGLAEIFSTVMVSINFVSDGEAFLTITYNNNEQNFDLIKKANNPPRGYRWFILCPQTGKKCLKLYFDGESFKTRYFIDNGLYEIQTIRFGRKRDLVSKIKKISKIKTLADSLNKAYGRSSYGGFPTHRYNRVLAASRRLDNLSTTL